MSEHAIPDATICVTKRDGTREPFVLAKLLRCIRLGLESAGESYGLDTSMAGGLGEAVHEYLKSSCVTSVVSSNQLADLVELVLNQTGHSAACMAIRQHHRFRDRQRKMLMVATTRPADGRFVQHRWNKAHIVQHLRRQHLLDAPASRMIAGRVEQLVFNCGLRVVTAGLVREMAKSELLAWGLMPGALVVKRTRPVRGARKVKDRLDRS